MSVFLAPFIGAMYQGFDANGRPLNQGFINTYLAGTSTPAATYTSSAGNVQNANPIPLGVDGRTPSEVWLTSGSSYKFVLTDSNSVTIGTYDNITGINDIATQTATITASDLRDYIAGCIGSTAGGSTTLSIAAGTSMDSTNTTPMVLASALAKTTAGWTVGNSQGGLDTGVIANSTWYHWYMIERLDTGVVDVIFSLSASAPTLPTNYTIYRRIFSWPTTAGGKWASNVQDGDWFALGTLTTEFSANNPGIAAVTRALADVPLGINVHAYLQINVINLLAAGTVFSYTSDLSQNDNAPIAGASDTPGCASAANSVATATVDKLVRTNTAQSVRTRLSYSDANVTYTANLIGYWDYRGRNA